MCLPPPCGYGTTRRQSEADTAGAGDTDELRREVLDLKIANRAKDMFIEQLQEDRETFVAERREYVEWVAPTAPVRVRPNWRCCWTGWG